MIKEKSPLVGVIMGSDSDLPIMRHASETLVDFDVPHENRIVSAHRTPERMALYARNAKDRGLKAIIAGAGGSAHLQGMTASETILPVMGVSIGSDKDPLMAAVGSQIKMHEGKQIAYIGEGKKGAVNAALYAVRILALSDPELSQAYYDYIQNMSNGVDKKDRQLASKGPASYLADREL